MFWLRNKIFLVGTLKLRWRCFQKLLLVWNFPVKQKWPFCQGNGYLWLYCCMNNLYILHRPLYAPTYSFWVLSSVLIIHFWLLPRLIPCASQWHTGWTLEKNINMNMNYSYPTTICESFFALMLKKLVDKDIFPIFAYKFSMVNIKNCK